MRILTALILAGVFLLTGAGASAQRIQVRHAEGLVHGFLSLRTLDGKRVADGDLIQNVHDARVTSRLMYHFKDGSLYDERVVFSESGHFAVREYHLTEKGPTFSTPLDMSIDPGSGRVDVRYTDDDGESHVEQDHMDLPSNLANGLVLVILKNLRRGEPLPELSMVVPTPKPRLVKLQLSNGGTVRFSTGGMQREATRYAVHIDIGGFTGLLAKLFGKQPPDTHVWILTGEAPAFVKSEGAMFQGGPIWRTELVSPEWPK
ncbi:MAG TPA: hypothetical protein VFK20_02275 [Vicinamibacterales bacterium]|nr:hypothetical protein [Vicinamibacterales bacterium]